MKNNNKKCISSKYDASIVFQVYKEKSMLGKSQKSALKKKGLNKSKRLCNNYQEGGGRGGVGVAKTRKPEGGGLS